MDLSYALRNGNITGPVDSIARAEGLILHGYLTLPDAFQEQARGVPATDVFYAGLRGARGSEDYAFFGVIYRGDLYVAAGCRWFTMSEARDHWRSGQRRAAATSPLLDSIEAWFAAKAEAKVEAPATTEEAQPLVNLFCPHCRHGLQVIVGIAMPDKPWTEDEDRKMLAVYDSGRPLAEVSSMLERPIGQTRARLLKYGRST
jgi:hypothetical protein